jgi:predicted nucleic acid-binding protein
MRFWDSSALIPLLIREAESEQMRGLLAADTEIIVSVITSIEVQSALWRRRHHGELAADQHAIAESTFATLSASWSEIDDIFAARQLALDLIARHVLRAADALQLAAALIACAADPATLSFVTLDRNLALAARAEGFTALP